MASLLFFVPLQLALIICFHISVYGPIYTHDLLFYDPNEILADLHFDLDSQPHGKVNWIDALMTTLLLWIQDMETQTVDH